MKDIQTSGVERTFDPNEMIVSKTNLKGHLTYANQIFIDLSGYKEDKLLGSPHSILRHPEMPRCVFKLLWDTISTGHELFAYVINLCANGDHYWVFAHVTPSFDESGNVVGYHSNRRVPDKKILSNTIMPLYKTLLAEENKFNNRKEGMASSSKMLAEFLKEKGVNYDEFIFSL